MPLKLDKIPIGKANDGRRKITDEQKLDMHRQYREGVSIHQIARNIGCHRRSVHFELFPEREKISKQHAISAKRWEAYNDTDTVRERMRKYRAKKKRLLQEGKLVIPTNNSTTKTGHDIMLWPPPKVVQYQTQCQLIKKTNHTTSSYGLLST